MTQPTSATHIYPSDAGGVPAGIRRRSGSHFRTRPMCRRNPHSLENQPVPSISRKVETSHKPGLIELHANNAQLGNSAHTFGGLFASLHFAISPRETQRSVIQESDPVDSALHYGRRVANDPSFHDEHPYPEVRGDVRGPPRRRYSSWAKPGFCKTLFTWS